MSFPEISPRMFSFNNPYGACPECGGHRHPLRGRSRPGRARTTARTLAAGALRPWAGPGGGVFKQTLRVLARRHGFSLDTPWAKLPKKARDIILHGEPDDGFEGALTLLDRRYRETMSEDSAAARWSASWRCATARPAGDRACARRRWRCKIAGRSIGDVVRFSIKLAAASSSTRWLCPSARCAIARRVLKEIRERLGFLAQVGLDYLTLDRPAATLSGGEGQRIRLATQIGSSLVGVLYILDEPSIGLHQRDNGRLLDTLKRLRDLGNTVLVVEHDEETIRAADFVVDLGPGRGRARAATWSRSARPTRSWPTSPRSPAASSPARRRSRSRAARRRGDGKALVIHEPARAQPEGHGRAHPARHASPRSPGCRDRASRPWSTTSCTGRSPRCSTAPRSGRALHDRIEGAQHLDKVIDIDQSPIGRTPRSNPATYTGVFTLIRTLLARTPDARVRGYQPGPLLVQRQGRPLRGVPGRRAGEDRDALPARRVRHLRGVQGQALQPRDARGPLQGQEHRRRARHDGGGGARVLRAGARHPAGSSGRCTTSGSTTSGSARPRRRCRAARRSGSSSPPSSAAAPPAGRSTSSTSPPPGCTSPTSAGCSRC